MGFSITDLWSRNGRWVATLEPRKQCSVNKFVPFLLELNYGWILKRLLVNFNINLLFSQVNNNIPDTNSFRGKIINLVIDCRVKQTTQRVQFDSSCLLFKLEGSTTTCKYHRSTSHPPSPMGTLLRMRCSVLISWRTYTYSNSVHAVLDSVKLLQI